ncbi:hypothetical protein DL240_04715 [Lujinxingia litoralis]|uniref:Hydrolase TatD n=1 Tax=Lujinxingia litoralis TaxID=2211119 RepID=A0A328CCP8_9DELT|nr:TatD family hydrolase [Lujinxingia litoralis]RAL25516.1 hypothetical protein DL240_04715 [Lujinxingia litoralis]
MSTPRLFDTHAHLDFPDIADHLDEILSAGRQLGLERVVSIGASRGLESNYRALEIARTYDFIRCTAGIHPHDAAMCTDEVFETIATEFASLPEVVAIGESGLDYHYDKAPREVQIEVFRRFLNLANQVQKPIVIHSREAEEDTVRLLHETQTTGGILHCFTASQAMADQVLELDFYISFSGIVTFKSARDILDVATRVPLDRLLIETDSPYLAPVPYRGKRNRPGYVRHTAEVIADARGITLDELAEATFHNACQVYNWPDA